MLRYAIVLLAAVVASGTAESADRAPAHHRWHRAVGLPSGLPRPHYNFRTTITLSEPYVYPRPSPRPPVDEAPEAPYAPVYADVLYVTPWFGVPLLPGSAAAPGYYADSYGYQNPSYGGFYDTYWNPLPYACGVYGYC